MSEIKEPIFLDAYFEALPTKDYGLRTILFSDTLFTHTTLQIPGITISQSFIEANSITSKIVNT